LRSNTEPAGVRLSIPPSRICISSCPYQHASLLCTARCAPAIALALAHGAEHAVGCRRGRAAELGGNAVWACHGGVPWHTHEILLPTFSGENLHEVLQAMPVPCQPGHNAVFPAVAPTGRFTSLYALEAKPLEKAHLTSCTGSRACLDSPARARYTDNVHGDQWLHGC